MRWLDSVSDSMDNEFEQTPEMVKVRGACCVGVHGVTKRNDLAAEQQQQSPSRPVNRSFISLNQCNKYVHMTSELSMLQNSVSSLGLTSFVITNELFNISRSQFLHR